MRQEKTSLVGNSRSSGRLFKRSRFDFIAIILTLISIYIFTMLTRPLLMLLKVGTYAFLVQ